MNKFETINTEYLRSSRTLETVLVSNNNEKKVFFVYNYEGYSFRVFNSIIDIIDFFQNINNVYIEFDNEDEVDAFFSNVDLIN